MAAPKSVGAGGRKNLRHGRVERRVSTLEENDMHEAYFHVDEVAAIVTDRCSKALANDAVEDTFHRIIGVVRMLGIHFLLDVASDLLVFFIFGEGLARDFHRRLHTRTHRDQSHTHSDTHTYTCELHDCA